MKEKILAALKAKFQGVNADILDRIAAMLAKTVTTEDQVTASVEGVTKDYIDVIEAYGDSRATEATQTAVGNYARRHGLKDGKPVAAEQNAGQGAKPGATPPSDGGGTAMPDWAKTLIDSNRKLAERLDRLGVAGRKVIHPRSHRYDL